MHVFGLWEEHKVPGEHVNPTENTGLIRRFEPGTFFLWGNSANHHITMLLSSSVCKYTLQGLWLLLACASAFKKACTYRVRNGLKICTNLQSSLFSFGCFLWGMPQQIISLHLTGSLVCSIYITKKHNNNKKKTCDRFPQEFFCPNTLGD